LNGRVSVDDDDVKLSIGPVRHAIALIVVVALRLIDVVPVPRAPVVKHVTGAVPGGTWHAATVEVVE